ATIVRPASTRHCRRGGGQRARHRRSPEPAAESGRKPIMTEPAPEVKPLRPIRRFDVFAETKRLEAIAHGEPEDVAKGYGIRIAKIVASRRFGGAKTGEDKKKRKERE